MKQTPLAMPRHAPCTPKRPGHALFVQSNATEVLRRDPGALAESIVEAQ